MSTTSPSIVAQGNPYFGSGLQADIYCSVTQLPRNVSYVEVLLTRKIAVAI